MKFLIISPGKAHDHTVAEGITEYQTRLEHRFALEWVHPRASTKEEEGTAILKLLKDDDYVVLLDERGKHLDSPSFAKLIEKQMQEGVKRVVFIIGGAFGVRAEVAARATTTLAVSSFVLPHMLVRLVLTEQLYRAVSIIDGGKYHHG